VRDAFRYLTSLLFVVVVVQVALAGSAAFDAVHTSDEAGSVTKKAVEDAWNLHAILGSAVLVVMLLLVLAAIFGKLGSPWLQLSGGLFVLGILQMLFATLGSSVPALGFLHAVNALAIFALSGLLAHRAWTQARRLPSAA
jgi:hypothetical protein